MWRHHPWLFGLLLAPLLYGAATPLGQIVIATCCGISLLLLSGRLANPSSGLHWGWIALLFTALLLPLVPLPAELVGLLSPQRLALAKAFPIAGEIPGLLPLSISPAETITRLWILLLCATFFCLARAAAREPAGARSLTLYLALAVCLLASSELWRRSTGNPVLPEIWRFEPNRSAGTFANRNHFAGWIAAASLFALGWFLRAWIPLQSARGTRLTASLGHRGESLVVALSVAFGIVVIILSGSRSGALAFVAGLIVWIILLACRSKSRSRLALIFFFLVGLGCVVLLVGNNLINRLAEAPADFLHRYPKLALWRETLAIAAEFPYFGTGWGTFRPAFNYFKDFGGDLVFLHAENDPVQFVMETGLLGIVVAGALLFHFGRIALRLVWRERCAEPEAAFGAFAALIAFAALACVEFVSQIPATAFLAATLAGFVIGSADALTAIVLIPPAAPPSLLLNDAAAPTATGLTRRRLFNLAWVTAIGVPLVLQSIALWHWNRGKAAPELATKAQHFRSSLDWWPCGTFRNTNLFRAELELLYTLPATQRPAAAARARAGLTRILRLDPYNAELRADRAEFDLTTSPDIERAKFEVREACRLNRLDERPALHFAKLVVDFDPGFALEIIRQANRSEQNLPQYLDLAWRIDPNTANLWPLVPNTVGGNTALANFGLEKKLPWLAANAWLRLTNQLAPAVVAEKMLAGNRPDLAFTQIPNLTTNRADRLLALRIYLADGKYETAIRHAEEFWLRGEASKTFRAPYPAHLTLETAHADWLAAQANLTAARRLAEKIFQQPLASRDLNLLFTLAGSFPRDLRLTWMLFSTQRDLGEANRDRKLLQAAATTAVRLANEAALFN